MLSSTLMHSCAVWLSFTCNLWNSFSVHIKQLFNPQQISLSFPRAKFSDRVARWLFAFKSPATFETNFAEIGLTITTLREILYTYVGPKTAPKRDFVYKVNANCVFAINSHKNSYFCYQWLKSIYFSTIMLQKICATKFAQKTIENKRSKKQRNT